MQGYGGSVYAFIHAQASSSTNLEKSVEGPPRRDVWTVRFTTRDKPARLGGDWDEENTGKETNRKRMLQSFIF